MATLTDYTNKLTQSVQEDYPIKTVTDAMTVKEYTLVNDFNDIVIPGLYRTQLPENPLNSIPVGHWGMLRVYDTGAWIRQDYYSDCESWAWARIYNKGENTWSVWKQTDGQCAITDYWHSGVNWWRKWSDGWIEQGGYTPRSIDGFSSVTFPIAFSQDNPNVQFTRRFYYDNDSTATQNRTSGVSSVTKTGFKCYDNGWSASGGSCGVWLACGY